MPPEKMRPGILALGLGTRGGHSIAVPKPAPAPKWFVERFGQVRSGDASRETLVNVGLFDLFEGMIGWIGWDSSITSMGWEG